MLRDRLYDGFKDMEEVFVNGDLDQRIAGNLNISFNFVEGESLMMSLRDVAVSSGSACTSASLEPSYVLRALGRSDELAHSSLRFTIGRFTTEAEVDLAIEQTRAAVEKLRDLSPLWDMKTLDEAKEIKNTAIAEELELPPVKIHCSVLAEDAIRAAIDDYQSKQ